MICVEFVAKQTSWSAGFHAVTWDGCRDSISAAFPSIFAGDLVQCGCFFEWISNPISSRPFLKCESPAEFFRECFAEFFQEFLVRFFHEFIIKNFLLLPQISNWISDWIWEFGTGFSGSFIVELPADFPTGVSTELLTKFPLEDSRWIFSWVSGQFLAECDRIPSASFHSNFWSDSVEFLTDILSTSLGCFHSFRIRFESQLVFQVKFRSIRKFGNWRFPPFLSELVPQSTGIKFRLDLQLNFDGISRTVLKLDATKTMTEYGTHFFLLLLLIDSRLFLLGRF